MEIHEAGRDKATVGIDLTRRSGETGADGFDASRAQRDIDEIRPTTKASIAYQEVHGALLYHETPGTLFCDQAVSPPGDVEERPGFPGA